MGRGGDRALLFACFLCLVCLNKENQSGSEGSKSFFEIKNSNTIYQLITFDYTWKVHFIYTPLFLIFPPKIAIYSSYRNDRVYFVKEDCIFSLVTGFLRVELQGYPVCYSKCGINIT